MPLRSEAVSELSLCLRPQPLGEQAIQRRLCARKLCSLIRDECLEFAALTLAALQPSNGPVLVTQSRDLRLMPWASSPCPDLRGEGSLFAQKRSACAGGPTNLGLSLE